MCGMSSVFVQLLPLKVKRQVQPGKFVCTAGSYLAQHRDCTRHPKGRLCFNKDMARKPQELSKPIRLQASPNQQTVNFSQKDPNCSHQNPKCSTSAV